MLNASYTNRRLERLFVLPSRSGSRFTSVCAAMPTTYVVEDSAKQIWTPQGALSP